MPDNYILKIATGPDLSGRYDWIVTGPNWCVASSAPSLSQATAEAADMLLRRTSQPDGVHVPEWLLRASPQPS